ncbi:MAG: metal-dependent transcriptional regulator [Candidatus Omnitrophica bacterium]|nr:metal-dependent transcriptional regulator [Candidatus Omnitrophota bacterium]
MDKRNIEELLEFFWMQREDGKTQLDKILDSKGEKVKTSEIDYLVKAGFLKIEESCIYFLTKGETIARRIIRGHRLAERLFTDVLGLDIRTIESNACKFEHIVHDEVAEAICTLLGHPKECPHGRPIPQGECCLKTTKEIARIILPLSEMPFGQRCKVVYITTGHLHRLNRLSSLGVMPGVVVSLRQRFPTPILDVEHTQIAIEEEILKDIYVRRIN